MFGALRDAGLEDYYRLRALDDAGEPAAPARPREGDAGYLDTDAFRARAARRAPDGESWEATFALDGLTCAACVWLVEEVARRTPGVVDARAALLTRRLDLRFRSGARLAALARDLGRFGYGLGIEPDGGDGRARDRKALLDLAVAFALAMNVMLLTLPYYLGLDSGALAGLFGWASLALATVSLAGPGRRFFASARLALTERVVTLDAPIALGLAAGWAGSLVHLVAGRYEGLYFDSLVVLVFALLAGRYVQARAVERALARARGLEASVPRLVRVLRGGRWQEVAPETLEAGERVRLEAGEEAPRDARVAGPVAAGAAGAAGEAGEAGEAGRLFDLQVVTGEEAPRRLLPGDRVPEGARLIEGAVELDVTASPGAGARARLVAEASAFGARRRRAPVLQDRLGLPFTVAVTALAAAAFALWLPAGGVEAALHAAMAVLVVACPCALGLATPAVGALFVGRAAAGGTLVRDPSVIERLGRARVIVLDKTGTVTEGRPEVASERWFLAGDRVLAERARQALAAVEATSAHPLARALAARLGAGGDAPGDAPDEARGDTAKEAPGDARGGAGDDVGVAAEGVATLAGEGIAGRALGLEVMALSPRAARARGLALGAEGAAEADRLSERGETGVVAFVREAAPGGAEAPAAGGREAAAGWRLAAVLGLRDRLREDAPATVRALRERGGFEVILVSGDHGRAVERVAARLGLARFEADRTPEEKLAAVARLEDERGPVVMVGDGLNDVAALRGSSLAVTLAHAAPGALAASEVILQGGGLRGLAGLVGMAAGARAVIRRGIAFALVYNAAGVGLAFAGALTPLAAALLMPASSLTVVLHAIASMRRLAGASGGARDGAGGSARGGAGGSARGGAGGGSDGLRPATA